MQTLVDTLEGRKSNDAACKMPAKHNDLAWPNIKADNLVHVGVSL